MLSFSHTIIGLVFGIYFNNPFLIFFLAMASHFIGDAILHWNLNFKKHHISLIALDILGGLFFSWFLLGNTFFTLPIWIAIAGSNTPDILQKFWNLSKKHKIRKVFYPLQPFFKLHRKIQFETNNIILGLIPQATIILLIALLIT